ncbi:MAG TPA: AAA family ATPase [Kiritimatiellia bacterium]|nr:AAA family ATPase [Kiritimatiellia bacterium]HRU70233.1 AAA family ATPase [Kiritimatiellia bacterium]
MAKLFLQQPEGDQLLTELDPTQSYLIGRSDKCSICIPAEAISSRHAQLTPVEEGWMLEDLGSSNGTTVNGEALGKAVLYSGCQIILGGQVVLLFIDDPAAADGAAEPAPAAEAQPAAKQGKRELKAQGASEEDLKLVKAMSLRSEKIRAEIAKVIIGQVDIIDQVMMVIIAGGHGLLVGMPGMAKTTLCATIAKVLDMEFKRVQFTPDLMPTDITGTEILEHDPVTDKKSFRFIKGPIFTNMLLADEINRTPPKTQASLLEAMQEKCVTVGNQTYKLDAPFFVLATQNPIEQEGTYPLPEAQQDRFMFNLWVDYPLEDEEETVVKATTVAKSEQPQKVITKDELLQLQAVVRKIPVSDHVIKYAVRLVRATRPQDEKSPDFIKKYVSNGAGPRAGQFLVLAAKARAVLEGRIHVSCNDVVKAAIPVLRHRIIANFAADSEGLSTTAIVERLLKTIEQPDDKDY